MATNPNAIFGEALATGPRQIPLSELQQQIAATRQTQAQTANIGSQMAQRQQETLGLQQQNTLRQRQLDDEQAVRQAIADATKTVPLTAPSVSIPAPGTDENGNPLPMSADQHALAASSAVQGPHVDWDRVQLTLLQQGRVSAAQTLQKTRQALETQDLENNKARLALFDQQTTRRNEIVAPVINAPPEQQDLLAAEAGQRLQEEGLGGGVGFTKEQARDLYQQTSRLVDPITEAKAKLGLTEAQTENYRQAALKTAEETKQYKLANDAAEQFLRNPDAVLGSGGMIDKIGLEPADAQTVKGAAMAAYQLPGTFQEKAAAVKGAILDGVRSVLEERRQIREKTNPQILQAETNKEIASRVGTARAMAGTGWASGILDQTERNKAIEAATKVDEEFADKVGAARQLQDFINLAQQNGNKAVPGMIGIAELKQLVNRVNRNELQAVGAGAGSAWDRIQGFAGGLTAGQPIPPDILRDTKILSGAMENAASRTYDLKRQAIGKNNNIAPPPRINVPTSEAAAPAAANTIPLITTKAAFDALPRGATYRERDGNTYRKP